MKTINNNAEIRRLAIIPARSGSSRLKHKNIIKIKNHPMIAYTIHAALDSKLFDKIHTSTDSEIYSNIARSYGSSIDFLRPKNLSESSSTSISVIRYTIEKYKTLGLEFDEVCLLQPTSPLRLSSHIIEAYYLFNKTKSKTVISVSKERKNSLPLIAKRTDMGLKSNINSIDIKNDSDKIVYPNGAIYIFDVKYILKNTNYYSNDTYFYEMNFRDSIDIDTIDDLKVTINSLSSIKEFPNPKRKSNQNK
jgi:CMP-N,N'-diacetyllegionaminic acid synthase